MDVLIAPRVDAERILCKYVKRLRVWFNGRTFGCQSNDPGSIPGTRTRNETKRLYSDTCTRIMPKHLPRRLGSRSEMDITTVFGTVVPGSNPGGSKNMHL